MKNIYFAPLEGVTGYTYRNAHQKFFGGVDAYYTPFLAPHQNKPLKGKEIKDVLPENNQGTIVIPQILTNRAEHFLMTAKDLKEMGYNHVNLNLGCPSGTVVPKKKGAGFLAEIEPLRVFLEEVADGMEQEQLKFSIKTRIGIEDIEEFGPILDLFNQYKLEKLIIHPRLQKDYYKNTPHMECFQYAVEHSKNSLCYNGDLFDVKAIQKITAEYPMVHSVMIGRGMLQNPALALLARGTLQMQETEMNKVIEEFMGFLCDSYEQTLYGDVPVLHKMKEIWVFMLPMFTNYEKYLKKIRKASTLSEYKVIIKSLFREEKFTL